MASSTASPHIGVRLPDSTYIPTVQETIIGSVWQTSTSKRDKLLELKGELASLSLSDSESNTPTLDDLATDRQKLDLWLVDGLRLIVKQVEEALPISTVNVSELPGEEPSKIPLEVLGRIDRIISDVIGTEARDYQLQEPEWNRILSSAQRELVNALESTDALQPQVLRSARDIVDVADAAISRVTQTSEFTPWLQKHQQPSTESLSLLKIDFVNSATRYQLLSTLALVKQLQFSWKMLTSITDQDTDRAAVQQGNLASNVVLITTLSAKKLSDVIHAHLLGNSSTRRIDSLWNLIDKDNDGLVDQVEMNHVCSIALLSAQGAVQQLLREALDAAPLDRFVDFQAGTKENWRQKRRRMNDKKRLMSLLQKTLNSHFDVELEMLHRLRCVYSWANKKHQSNKMDSVLVHEDGGGIVTSVVGRKRYVELHPKISLTEFREVQGIHFPQLDRIGQECLTSFRDELWVQQGKGRQNQELQRDCALFFVALCLLDFIVLSL
jgi:hypothetical protein